MKHMVPYSRVEAVEREKAEVQEKLDKCYEGGKKEIRRLQAKLASIGGLQRFEMQTHPVFSGVDEIPIDSGEWVKWSDIQAILRESEGE